MECFGGVTFLYLVFLTFWRSCGQMAKNCSSWRTTQPKAVPATNPSSPLWGWMCSRRRSFHPLFAAAAYLEQTKFKDTGKKVYIIGEKGISEELDLVGVPWLGGEGDAGKQADMGSGGKVDFDHDVGAVIVGFDRHINYYKLQYAQLCLNELPGCEFIATNLDRVTHLTHAQEWAGGGTMVAAVSGCTGREPTLVGKPAPLNDWLHCPEIWHHRQIPNLHGRWQIGHWHCFRAQQWIEDLFDTFWSHKWGWAAWTKCQERKGLRASSQSSMWTPCVSFFLHDCLSAARVKEFEFSSSGLAELYHFRLGPGALFGKMLGTASFSTFAFIHLWTWCLCNLHRSARYLLGTSVSTSIDLFVRLQLALQNHRQVQKNTMERLLSMLDMFRCWGPYTLIFIWELNCPWPSHSSRNLFVSHQYHSFTS